MAEQHWSVSLLGPKILTKPKTTGVPTASALAGKKVIALYFSASWCPPCRSFTPLLTDFYNANKDDLEIIFVSSDRDEDSFSQYFGKMPWLASVPGYSGADANARQRKMAEMFKIQGIPSLIILDAKTGNFITDNGRTQVMQTSSDESRKALVETWKSSEAVSIDQAVFSSGSNSWLGSLLMFVAKNPVYLFGLLYFVKQFFRYLESLGDDEEGKKEL